MKKQILLLIAISIFATNSFSQVSFFVKPTQYTQARDMKSFLYYKTATFDNVESRYVADVEILYNLGLSKDMDLQFGFSQIGRISEKTFDFSQSKIAEEFINIPVILNYSINTEANYSFFFGAGVNLSTNINQKLLFPENTIIPNSFITEYGAFGYYKFGLITKFGFKRKISDDLSFITSFTGLREFEKLSIINDNNNAFFYNSFSVNLGVLFNISKKE